MTLSRFIKTLQKLEKQHGGRMPVCANTYALRQTCNGAWDIIDVSEMHVDWVTQFDGDGFSVMLKNGFVKERKCLVLK